MIRSKNQALSEQQALLLEFVVKLLHASLAKRHGLCFVVLFLYGFAWNSRYWIPILDNQGVHCFKF